MAPASRQPALPCPIAPYVPQSRGMCLLDRLIAVDADSLQAEITPAADGVFATVDGVPGWVGLEWLAQGVAAWAGWHASSQSEAPPLGFLVGTRRFETDAEHFATGETFSVTIRLDFHADNGLGHFDGEIANADGTCLAHGTLTVLQPPTRDNRLADTADRESRP